MMYDPRAYIERALMLTRPGAADGGQMVTTQGQQQQQPAQVQTQQAQPAVQAPQAMPGQGQQATPSSNMYDILMQRLSQAPAYRAAQPTDFEPARFEAPTRSGEIANIYHQFFNRAPDVEGAKYWMESGLGGADLARAIIAGAQGPDVNYYGQNFSGFERLTPTEGSAARGPVYGPDGRAYSSPADAMMRGIFNYTSQPIRQQWQFDPATDPSRVINAKLAAKKAAAAAGQASPATSNPMTDWLADQQFRDAMGNGG